MSAQRIPTISPEEYLAIERAAAFKSEYVCGQMWAMSGASRDHNYVASNLQGLIFAALRGKPCRVFGSDLRVAVSRSSAYFYPDVTIVCGQPEFTDIQGDTLVNPLVIVEIASPSTAQYDRTVKVGKYFQIPSVRQVVLVAQDSPSVEWFTLTEGVQEMAQVTGLAESITLESIGVTLALSDIYDGVVFDV